MPQFLYQGTASAPEQAHALKHQRAFHILRQALF